MELHSKIKLFLGVILFIFSMFQIKSYREKETIQWRKELAQTKKEEKTQDLLNIVDEIIKTNITLPKYDYKKADFYCVFGNSVLLLSRQESSISCLDEDAVKYPKYVDFGYNNLFSSNDLNYPSSKNDTFICSNLPQISIRINDDYYFNNSVKILTESGKYEEIKLFTFNPISYYPEYGIEYENKIRDWEKDPILDFNKELSYIDLNNRKAKLSNGYINKLGVYCYRGYDNKTISYYWGGDYRKANIESTIFRPVLGKSYQDYSEYNDFYNTTYSVTLCKKKTIINLGKKKEITKKIAKIPIIDLRRYKHFDYVCINYQGLVNLSKDLGVQITTTILPMILKLEKTKLKKPNDSQQEIIKKIYSPYIQESQKFIVDKMKLLSKQNKYYVDSTLYISHELLSKLDSTKKQQLFSKVADAYSYEKREPNTLFFVDDSTNVTIFCFDNNKNSKEQ